MNCEICDDVGVVVKNGKDVKCKCIFEAQLKKMLPALLLSKEYIVEIESVRAILTGKHVIEDKVYYTAPIAKYFNMLKSIAYTEIVKNNGNYTMEIVGTEDIHKTLFSSDGSIADYYKQDLVAMVYRKSTQENKMIVPAMEQILVNRQMAGLKTLIWISPDIHIKNSTSGLYYDQVNLEKYKEFGYKLIELPYAGSPLVGATLLPKQVPSIPIVTKKRGS